MILLMPLAAVLIINAVPAPWETGHVFANTAVEPTVAFVHAVPRDAPPAAAALAATPELPGSP